MGDEQQPALAITGIGGVTSLGLDIVSTCAALRAGLARPGPTEIGVLDEEAMEEVPVLGHPVVGVAEGFQGLALHAALGAEALRDLARQGGLQGQPEAFWSRTALWVVVSPARGDELCILDELLRDALPGKLRTLSGLPIHESRVHFLPHGHAGVLYACEEAGRAIPQRGLERGIILGIDSLVDGDAVGFFREAGRLKTAEDAAGLMPGQAAAALLVEDPRAAAARKARIMGYVGAVATASDPRPFLHEDAVFGRALAEVVLSVARSAKRISEVYVDLNGEARRAMDWGHATVRIRAGLGYLPEKTNVVAVGLGDTGASSGALAVAAAVRSFARGYATGSEVLVCSRSDEGETAAALIHS